MARLLAVLLVSAALTAAPAQTYAQGMCDKPQESCGRLLTPECLGRVGAAALPAGEAGADCEAQMQTYRECLTTVAAACGPQAAPGRAAAPETPPQPTGQWIGLWRGWVTCSNGDVWDDVQPQAGDLVDLAQRGLELVVRFSGGPRAQRCSGSPCGAGRARR